MKTKFLLLFCLTFLLLDIRADECSMKCNSDGLFLGGYKDKLSYSYSYEGMTTINVNGADNQETGVKISANIVIHNRDNCSNILEIKRIRISDLDGTKYEKPSGIKKPVKFAFQGVAIKSTICAEEGDTPRSLNIKRSILSTLQMNYMEKVKEVDINGVCLTKFTVNGSKVTKTKDLNSCLKREDNEEMKFAMYKSDTAFKTANIIQANLKAEAKVESGFVVSNEIREEYLYKPFASEDFNAKASVFTRIDYNNLVVASVRDKCVSPKSIIYENPKENEHSDLANIEGALATATKYLEGHAQLKSASFFNALIRVLRFSDREHIQKAHARIDTTYKYTNKVLAKKVFLDALFRTGSTDSIEVTLQLLKKNEITPLQKRLALSSLANVRQASIETVKAVADLMVTRGLPNEIYLGIGAVTAVYCKENDCTDNKDIADLSGWLVAKLDDCKVSDKENEDRVIFILKGLKNFNHVQENTISTLTKCASDKTVSMRVRVAAIEAFAADTCADELTNAAYTILKDQDEDSELRIKAYLALTKCPTRKLVHTAQEILGSEEPIYQVCSFITSSIKNIKKSNNLENLRMRELFENFKFENKFSLDPRRYSQAYKFRYTNQNLGMTSLLGSNIIYSQNSFLPRSVNLNLTAEVFGRNVNLIEIGVRQGNIDQVIEEFLGPQGIFRTNTLQKIYDHMKKTTNGIHEKIQNRLKKSGHKTKRDVQQEIAALAKKLKTDIASYKGNLDIDVFVNLFGSESVFLSLGDDQHFSMESLIDRVFDFVEGGIDGAEKFSHEVRSHMLLLDTQIVYPTSAGVAVRISAEAASTGKLSFGGSIDLRQILSDVLNSKIDIQLVPSASVDITTKLEVDADVFSTGLKVFSSLHTSTGIQVTAKLLNNGKGFDINVGLPLEKQEIVSVSNDVSFFTKLRGSKDVNKELKFNAKMVTPKTNCSDEYVESFGLEMCSEMAHPENYEMGFKNFRDSKILLNSQFKYQLYLKKVDLKGLRLYGMKGSDGNKDFMELVFDASGDSHSRKVAARAELLFDEQSYSLTATLDSPTKKGEVLFSSVNFNNEKSFALKVAYDKKTYNGKIGRFVFISPSVNVALKPILEFSGHEMDTIKLNGDINVEATDEYTKLLFDGLTLQKGREVYTFSGWDRVQKNQIDWDIKMMYSYYTLSSLGRLFHSDNGVDEASVEFKSTKTPKMNFAYTHNILIDTNSYPQILEGKMSFVSGPDLNSIHNMLNFSSKSTLSDDDENFTTRNKLSYPALNLDYTTDIDYIEDKKQRIFIDAKFLNQKTVFELDFDDKQANENEQYGKMKILSNDNGIELFFMENVESNITSNYEIYMAVHPGGKYEITAKIKDIEEEDDEDFYIMAALKVPDTEDTMFETAYRSTDKLWNVSAKVYTKSKIFFDTGVSIGDNLISDSVDCDVNIFINNYVSVKGKAALTEESLTSEINIKMEKVDKVLQFEFNGKQNENNFTGVLTLYTDYMRDKSQLYKIESSNSFDEEFAEYFESRTAFYFHHKEAMLKMLGKKSGDIFDEKIHFELDFLDPHKNSYKTLFNEHKIRELKVNDTYELVLQRIDGATGLPRKLTIQADLINYEESYNTGTATLKTEFVKESGENAKYVLEMMSGNEDHRKQLKFETAVLGSLVSEKWKYYFWSDYYFYEDEQFDINYNSNGNYDTVTSFDLKGRYAMDLDEEQLYSNTIDMTINLPNENLRTLALSSQASYNASSIYTDTESYGFGSLIKIDVNSDSYVYELNNAGSDDGMISAKFATEFPGRQPFSVEMDWKNIDNSTSDKKDLTLDVIMKANGQILTYSMTGYSDIEEPAHGEYMSTLILPSDKGTRTVKAICKYTIESQDKFMNSIDLDIDGKKYYSSVNVDYNEEATSMIDVKASYPNSKPMRFYARSSKLPEQRYKGHTTLENFGDFNLDFILSTVEKSNNDIDVKGYIDCPKVHLKRVDFTGSIISPKAGDWKKIQFEAKENGKTIARALMKLLGSKTNLGLIVKGEGKITIRGVEKQAYFEYFKEENINRDGKDSLVSMRSSIGDTSFTFNSTNSKQISLLSISYCEAENDCARIRFNSDVKKGDEIVADITEVFEMELDLKKLGFPTQIDLKSRIVTVPGELPIYAIDFKKIRNDVKYQFEAVATKPDNDYKTHMSVTLPSRVIYFETTTMSIDSYLNDAYSAELILYLNKNDRKSKIHYKSSASLTFTEDSDISAKSAGYLIYPGAPKEIQYDTRCKVNLDNPELNFAANIDIFDKKEKEIVIEAYITPKSEEDNIHYNFNLVLVSKGNNFRYNANGELFVADYNLMKLQCLSNYKVENDEVENTLFIFTNTATQKFHIKTPAGNMLDIKNTIDYEENTSDFKIHSSMVLYDKVKYLSQTTISTNDGLKIKYNEDFGKPSESFTLDLVFTPNEVMEISSSFIESKKAYPLFKISYTMPEEGEESVSLKETNLKNMGMLMDSLGANIMEIEKYADEHAAKNNEIYHKLDNTLFTILMKSILRVDLPQYLMKELRVIHKEIKADKFLELVGMEVDLLLTVTSALIDNIYAVLVKTNQMKNAIYNGFVKFNHNLQPLLNESAKRAMDVASSAVEPMVDLVVEFMTFVGSFMERHSKHFMQMNSAFTKFIESIEKANNDVHEIFSKLAGDVSNAFVFLIPLDESIQLLSSENLHMTLDYIGELIADFVPEKEWKDLYNAIVHSYEQKKYDNSPEMRKERLTNVITKTQALAAAAIANFQAKLEGAYFPSNWLTFLDSSDENQSDKPSIGSYSNVSNTIEVEFDKFSSFIEVFRAVRPIFYPEDIVTPYKLKGFITEGRHVFTFDGRYLTTPGDCKFVVAHDAVDGNFTIVMNVKDEKAKSITLIDKGGYSLKVNDEGKVMVNGYMYHGFPVKTYHQNIAVKEGNMFLLKSKYGVTVRCNDNLDVCEFKVSGFYYGKLRGLLGDGNSEPFDDLRLPNGTVVSSEYDFGTSYGLNQRCEIDNPKIEKERNYYEDDICKELFEDSELEFGNYVLDNKIYMEACKRAVHEVSSQEEVMPAACSIAKTYALACMANFFPVSVPDVCIQCNLDENSYDADDDEEIEIETSKTQADIVLVIETERTNRYIYNDMVLPLISEVLRDLKEKEVDDVKIHLVGLDSSLYRPTLYETQIKNFNMISKISFDDQVRPAQWKFMLRTDDLNVDEYLKAASEKVFRVSGALGVPDMKLYSLGLDIVNLRPNAMKSIILVQSQKCPTGFLAMIKKWFTQESLKNQGILTHLITPLEYFEVPEIREHRNAIGFNDKEVLFEGEMRWSRNKTMPQSDIKYSEDQCIDLALETDGSVFSSKQFRRTHPMGQPSVLKIAAQTIVDSMLAAPSAMTCTCDGGITGWQSSLSCQMN